MAEIKVIGRSVVCELATGEKFLIGDIEIHCPSCGELRYQIPGHHLRSILRLLAEWVEEHAELTGPGEIKELHRSGFRGTAPADPTKN